MYILVGPITAAARLARILEGASGYPADVVHTPAQLNKGGCSYSVRINDSVQKLVVPLSKEYGLQIKKMYTEDIIDGERVYHAVS